MGFLREEIGKGNGAGSTHIGSFSLSVFISLLQVEILGELSGEGLIALQACSFKG